MVRVYALVFAASSLAAAETQDPLEFFEKRIRPVLAERCYSCHSTESQPVAGELLVDSAAGLRKGGATGDSAVIPYKPDESPLLRALRHQGAVKMPPGPKLPDEVIRDFEQWIRMGAPDPRTEKAAVLPPSYDFDKARQHWAYRPITNPAPPAVKDPLWSKHAVDRFVKAKLDEKGLTPAGLASKRTLIRRATYDLTGLPPTPEEVDAFLKDTSPDAFAKVVDRLLASPQYGERWGRRWLDVARYADTSGCNSDFPVPPAYRYRDWVIRSFNEDKPYTQFLREQIAGDLLEAKDDEDRSAKLIATGYIANSRRFASSKGEHHLTIDDTIDNVGKGMLGLTLSCARCHDHKYDAIPQRDYFGLYGIFESTTYTFPGVETVPRPHDYIALGGPESQKKLTEWEDKIKDTYAQIRELIFGESRHKPDAQDQVKRLKGEVLALEIKPPDVPLAYGVKEAAGRDAYMHRKGDPKKLGDQTARRWLTLFGAHPLPEEEKGSGRRQLADWITDPANPLTPRVMANRIWAWHFGKGIVATPNEFGTRGEPPTHPELLDWLASRFKESGWSVKQMHRTIMLSRAYRLAAAHNETNAKLDAKNSYLWRFDRRRLEAEELRDSLLALTGELDPSPGGPHPFPPLHQWNYTQHKQFFAQYDHNRRSVYLMQQRLKRHPLLELFDGADPNASTPVRNTSITALQALALMNNSFFHERADALAVRVGMAYSDTPSRIGFAYRLAVGRQPSPTEVAEAARYVASARSALAGSGIPAERHSRTALASYLRTLLASDEFFFVD